MRHTFNITFGKPEVSKTFIKRFSKIDFWKIVLLSEWGLNSLQIFQSSVIVFKNTCCKKFYFRNLHFIHNYNFSTINNYEKNSQNIAKMFNIYCWKSFSLMLLITEASRNIQLIIKRNYSLQNCNKSDLRNFKEQNISNRSNLVQWVIRDLWYWTNYAKIFLETQLFETRNDFLNRLCGLD